MEMSQHPDHQHHVRRVVLPSGKTIEVVYFEDQVFSGAAGAERVPVPVEDGDLHVCGSCDSELVYPVEWDEAGATHWEVTPPLPELRVGRHRRLRARTPSSASTRSSTAAPRLSSAISSA